MKELIDFFGILTFYVWVFLYWPDTDEELKEWKTKFDDRIRDLGTQIFKLEREQDDTKTKSNFLGQTIKDSIWDVSKLQNEANVSELHTFCYCKTESLLCGRYF